MKALLLGLTPVSTLTAHEVTTSGIRFLLDGRPFPYTGISFFNAIYNANFNRSSEYRSRRLRKFQQYGINVLRVWSQWDSKLGLVDAGPDCTLHFLDGRLRSNNVERLKEILADADREGMVIELTLFSHESWQDGIKLGREEADRALASLTRATTPLSECYFPGLGRSLRLCSRPCCHYQDCRSEAIGNTDSPGAGV